MLEKDKKIVVSGLELRISVNRGHNSTQGAKSNSRVEKLTWKNFLHQLAYRNFLQWSEGRLLGLPDLTGQDGCADTNAHVVLDLVVKHVHSLGCKNAKCAVIRVFKQKNFRAVKFDCKMPNFTISLQFRYLTLQYHNAFGTVFTVRMQIISGKTATC